MPRVAPVRVAAFAAVGVLLCAAAGWSATRVGDSPAAVPGLVAGVGAWFVIAAAAVAARLRRLDDERMRRLAELRELLHLSDSEAQARQLLLRHVQRLLPDAGAAVLSRVDSEARLEPVLGERIADTPLRALVVQRLTPESCLAVRLGRGHARGAGSDEEPLVACEACGRFPGEVACEPLRAGGRTLGALLVTREAPLRDAERTQLREAARLAAPALAIQRSLEVVERHAARDPLTGLPNRRAADESLRRLTAQAGRSLSPVAAVIVDLDRFRSVNDRFGHEQGDATLAVVGRALAAGVRASDFVARYGGEEFIVLAPDTDRHGAAELAEKLRGDVEQLVVPGVGRVTASFGVAALPEDALDGETLVRRADRALALAKALGRNRVQGAEATPTPEG
jgi:diguanylate cyclase (GGDEF)-like protein